MNDDERRFLRSVFHDEEQTEPEPEPDPLKGNRAPNEGKTPGPLFDEDAQMREFVRELFDNPD